MSGRNLSYKACVCARPQQEKEWHLKKEKGKKKGREGGHEPSMTVLLLLFTRGAVGKIDPESKRVAHK